VGGGGGGKKLILSSRNVGSAAPLLFTPREKQTVSIIAQKGRESRRYTNTGKGGERSYWNAQKPKRVGAAIDKFQKTRIEPSIFAAAIVKTAAIHAVGGGIKQGLSMSITGAPTGTVSLASDLV